MKKIIIPTILLICIAFFFTSCGESAAASKNPDPTIVTGETCHTTLVEVPLSTSVVAKEEKIRTGQSVSGAVKDHAKNLPGYTKEMFMADNPQIAGRPVIRKMNPCDSTKVQYIGVPLYSGDVILLRLPYRIDTIAGYAESIVWKSSSGHIKQVIDIDEKGRVMVEHQNICCNGIVYNPCPPQPGVIPPVNAIPPGDRINIPPSDTVTPPKIGDGTGDRLGGGNGYSKGEIPWWGLMIIVLLVAAIAMILKVMKQKQADPNSVENITAAVRKEGKQTRDHVTAAIDGLGSKIDTQTTAVQEQTKASNTTNGLLQKWLDQQGIQ